MKISATLSRYLAKNYLINLAVMLFALLAVIYLFDTVELIRRAAKHADVPLTLVLQMGLLKLPEVGQMLFPFAILFSAMFTFWQLTKRHELIVVRAAGFSVWQFLAPVLMVAAVVGILQMTAINPVGAVFVSKFEQLDNTYLKRQENQIAVFREGLWLRQSVGDQRGYVIIHAAKIEQPQWRLHNVMALHFGPDDSYIERLDAKEAVLEEGRWLFRDVRVNRPQKAEIKEEAYALQTGLTLDDIKESFAPPATMSFWNLPGYIKTLEETGFDATSLRVHYQSLLSQPLMFAAMVLLAATVSMRPPRFRGTMTLISFGVFIGFFVFFMSSFLQALGASGQIPVLLAAWSPALVCLLLGVGVMMHVEDG
jgi:lipopolysaccharide export system permease protein